MHIPTYYIQQEKIYHVENDGDGVLCRLSPKKGMTLFSVGVAIDGLKRQQEQQQEAKKKKGNAKWTTTKKDGKKRFKKKWRKGNNIKIKNSLHSV